MISSLSKIQISRIQIPRTKIFPRFTGSRIPANFQPSQHQKAMVMSTAVSGDDWILATPILRLTLPGSIRDSTAK